MLRQDVDPTEDDHLKLLLEMFPALSTAELSYCLDLAEGDLEQAVQWVLHRQELGQTLPAAQGSSASPKVRVICLSTVLAMMALNNFPPWTNG